MRTIKEIVISLKDCQGFGLELFSTYFTIWAAKIIEDKITYKLHTSVFDISVRNFLLQYKFTDILQ